jgi:hypothetical protein
MDQMKIQITESDIRALASTIGDAAVTVLTAHVRKMEEQGLIHEINSTTADERARVVTYLSKTKVGVSPARGEQQVEVVTVESGYLRERLHISPVRMKALRDSLARAGTLHVFETSHQRLTIVHRRAISAQ